MENKTKSPPKTRSSTSKGTVTKSYVQGSWAGVTVQETARGLHSAKAPQPQVAAAEPCLPSILLITVIRADGRAGEAVGGAGGGVARRSRRVGRALGGGGRVGGTGG